jgi:hypothetical protein
MGLDVAIFFALTILGVICVAVASGLSFRLMPEGTRGRFGWWLLGWSGRGLFLPILLWGVMNVGISFSLQPFMPQVQYAQNSGLGWVPVFLRVLGTGVFLVGSFWGAVTLGWTVMRASREVEGEGRSTFRALCLTCLIGLGIPAGGMIWLGGFPIVGLAALFVMAPIAGYAPNLIRPRKSPPMYSRAIARMKFGKYGEAETEIIRQLENHQDDFDGWMMLAELYATRFGDLPEAEQTILEICDQPRTTPSQISIALHKLADWHLKVSQDPEPARRALQVICDRLPGTHLARMAQLRAQQLPATAAELRENQSASPVPLPALGDAFEEPFPPLEETDTTKATAAANACVERLRRNPNDIFAREKFARLLAERLNNTDMALEQMTLLLNLPDQPDLKRAEWLGTVAAWHLKFRHDVESGRHLLQRLLQEYPNTPQAFAARRRLELMDMEADYGRRG